MGASSRWTVDHRDRIMPIGLVDCRTSCHRAYASNRSFPEGDPMRFLTVAIIAICAFGPAFAVDDGVPPIPIIVGLGPAAGGGSGGGNAATLEGKTWESPGTIGST